MQFTKQRSVRAYFYGLFLLGHPGPVGFHLLAIILFALMAGWPHPIWATLLFVVGAHTAMQLSIAMINDYCDRKLDAAGKPEKPIPRGLVTPREALLAGCLMIALMSALLLPLPSSAWLFTFCYLTLGMAYNLGLKSTPLSGIVFALAMPLIPLYAFAGMGRSLPFLFWFIPLGLLLGVALNLANSLPDLEEDAASSARTLAVTLGVKRAFLVCNVLLLLSALLILSLALTGVVPLRPLALLLTLLLAGLLFMVLLVFFGPGKPAPTRKAYFYIVTLTCIVLATGWFFGVLLR